MGFQIAFWGGRRLIYDVYIPLGNEFEALTTPKFDLQPHVHPYKKYVHLKKIQTFFIKIHTFFPKGIRA